MRDNFFARVLIRNLRAGPHPAHYTCDMMSRKFDAASATPYFKNGGAAEGEMLMITRRRLLEAAGTGAVVAVAGRELSRTFVAQAFVTEAEAQAAGLSLPVQLPQGTRQGAVLEAVPSKAPLIQLS